VSFDYEKEMKFESKDKYGNAVVTMFLMVFVKTSLIHAESCERMDVTLSLITDVSDPHNYGSNISYLRRYGLSTLLATSAEDDDGKNQAKKNKEFSQNNQVPLPNKAPTKASEAKQEFDPKEYVTKLKRSQVDVEMFLSICRDEKKSWADFKTPADIDVVFIKVDQDLEALKMQGM
jgi:hypothetical protein